MAEAQAGVWRLAKQFLVVRFWTGCRNYWQQSRLKQSSTKLSETGEHTLKRSLGASNLIALGIGAIIGTGIFVLTGPTAAHYAGPAVVYSFMVAAVACVFAGLCYAEFAAMIPVAGSAYTYGYATLGEIFAWIIGWDLVLEYAFGAATVCSGWSGYVLSLLAGLSISICRRRLRALRDRSLCTWNGHWELLNRIASKLAMLESIRRRCHISTASSTWLRLSGSWL